MSEVNTRLFNNPYFRSIDTLLALATYRFSAFVEWLPVLLVFMVAALFDGFLLRIIKSKEFLQHNPEMYALQACAAIVTVCARSLRLFCLSHYPRWFSRSCQWLSASSPVARLPTFIAAASGPPSD